MICKKASRVVLPNGGTTERMSYEPMRWWLLDGDDDYWIYTAEDLEKARWYLDREIARVRRN